jgi:hypothetical protein
LSAVDKPITPTPFVFAVPLKPRRFCSDWDAAQANLRRTLRSIQQATHHYPVETVVACHDEPDLAGLDESRITVLRMSYPEPEVVTEGARDKARKRRYIGAWLRETVEGDVHVMFLDADDLVHRDLVSAVVKVGPGEPPHRRRICRRCRDRPRVAAPRDLPSLVWQFVRVPVFESRIAGIG